MPTKKKAVTKKKTDPPLGADGPQHDPNLVDEVYPVTEAGGQTGGAQPRDHVEARAVTAGDTAKFEAEIDAAFANRANEAALVLAYKNCGAAVEAAQAAAGFSDLQMVAAYDGLVEAARTLGAGTPWA